MAADNAAAAAAAAAAGIDIDADDYSFDCNCYCNCCCGSFAPMKDDLIVGKVDYKQLVAQEQGKLERDIVPMKDDLNVGKVQLIAQEQEKQRVQPVPWELGKQM